MKKFSILLFTVTIAVSGFAQGSKVTGFRDLVWGIHKDSVYSNGEKLKFTKDREADEPNTYYLKDDNLTLGAAKLEKISYYFNEDDRFKKVVLRGKDEYLKDMKDIVTFKFGGAKNVQDPGGNLKVYEWQVGDVSLRLTHNGTKEMFRLIIESNWDITQTYVDNMSVKDIPYNGEVIKGFREMEWLDHKDSIYMNGEKVIFILDREADEPNTYYIDNDKLRLGSARLTSINYVFNEDDKLNKVVMKGNKDYFDDVKFILNHKFGGAEDVNTFGADLSVTEWKIGDTTLKISQSGGGDKFSLIIESSRDRTESYIKNMNVPDF